MAAKDHDAYDRTMLNKITSIDSSLKKIASSLEKIAETKKQLTKTVDKEEEK